MFGFLWQTSKQIGSLFNGRMADMNVTAIKLEITFILHTTWQIAAFESIFAPETHVELRKIDMFLSSSSSSSHYLWGWTEFRFPFYANNSFFLDDESNKEYCKCKAIPLNPKNESAKAKKKIFSRFINKEKKALAPVKTNKSP